MPDKILKSSFYQPSTSYRWKSAQTSPIPCSNPGSRGWLPTRRRWKSPRRGKTALRRKIDHAERVIEELKRYSFLISEYDPFIVVPLGVVNQSTPFSPQFGDYAVVIVGDKLYPALVGDAGPRYKTGEGSLRLSREINPKAGPYSRPVSDLKVSYLISPVPQSPRPGLPTMKNYGQMPGTSQRNRRRGERIQPPPVGRPAGAQATARPKTGKWRHSGNTCR